LRFLQRLTPTAWSSDVVYPVAAIFRVCPQRLYAFTTREHRFTVEKILGACAYLYAQTAPRRVIAVCLCACNSHPDSSLL